MFKVTFDVPPQEILTKDSVTVTVIDSPKSMDSLLISFIFT